MTDLVNPGGVGIKSLTLIKPDRTSFLQLLPQLFSIQILESINSKFIAGQAEIADTQDLLGRFGVIGGEFLIVEWQSESFMSTENDLRESVFKIVSIDSVTPSTNADALDYRLSFISELAYEDQYYGINKAFTNSISDTANIVFNELVDNALDKPLLDTKNIITTDDTEGVVDFVIPGDSVFDAMDYLTDNAFSSTDTSSYYLFFQNKDGYQFRNIEKLITEKWNEKDSEEFKQIKRYTYGSMSAGQDTTNTFANYTIKGLSQIQRNAFGAMTHDGRLHNQVNSLDYLTKSVSSTALKMYEEYENYNLMEDKLMISPEWKSIYGDSITESNWIYKDGSAREFHAAEALHHKWALNTLLYNNMISVVIHGNSSLTAGDIIEIIMPSTNSLSEEKADDNFIGGYFLIKDIRHKMRASNYECELTLTRFGARDLRNED